MDEKALMDGKYMGIGLSKSVKVLEGEGQSCSAYVVTDDQGPIKDAWDDDAKDCIASLNLSSMLPMEAKPRSSIRGDEATQFSLWLRRLEDVMRLCAAPQQKGDFLICYLDGAAREKARYMARGCLPTAAWGVKLDNPLTFEQAVAKAQMVEQLLAKSTADRLINPQLTPSKNQDVFRQHGIPDHRHIHSRSNCFNCRGVGHHARQCPSLTVQLDMAPSLEVFAMGDSDIPCAIGMTGVPVKLNGRADLQFEKELDEHINELLRAGHIVESDTPWIHNTVFVKVLVKKEDGSLRVCLNFRPLNEITIHDHYPLPRIKDILAKIAGHKYYTTLDLASSYMQFLLSPESQEKCGWATHRGVPIRLIIANICAKHRMERGENLFARAITLMVVRGAIVPTDLQQLTYLLGNYLSFKVGGVIRDELGHYPNFRMHSVIIACATVTAEQSGSGAPITII
ncbi:hypothetical protein RB195_004580 [Necator americanus]|uniref:CCHC-type domain-containing protein n=1 Tax=Necator americanus TaxID=51031 RepID=A0ABR1BN52_NECAM